MSRCRSCRRPFATPADWAAFASSSCNADECLWGADRCWSSGDCGIPASNVAELVRNAKTLRCGRPWPRVPHEVSA